MRSCGVGTGAELGPGVMLLDRTRLPGAAAQATVGAKAKVGGGAVIAGIKVGEGAFVLLAMLAGMAALMMRRKG